MNKGIFITGTDTGVGKTIISAWLALQLQAAYWKPIQTGSIYDKDSATVRSFGKITVYPESYLYPDAVSPHLAASLVGAEINLANISFPSELTKFIIVEGAGGIMVPLNRREFMVDLIKKLRLPIVIVARSCLGTINHTLLTIEQARISGVEIKAVILNGELNNHNMQAISYYGNTEVFFVKKYENLTELVMQPIPARLLELLK
jgi:dethiobiotin synthetase